MDESGQLSVEDVIPNRASLLVFSRKGYIKRMPTDLFSVQVGLPAVSYIHNGPKHSK